MDGSSRKAPVLGRRLWVGVAAVVMLLAGPVLVGTMSPVAATAESSTLVQVSTAGNHSCVALADGSIQCWGRGVNGQLGNGTNTDSDAPVSVTGIVNAIQVATGDESSCAVLSDGVVKCWGSASFGALLDGAGVVVPNPHTGSNIPVSVTGIGNAVQVAVGVDHWCAVLADGAIKCWGDTSFGQRGNGANSDAPVAGIDSAIQVAAGAYHSCALLEDGSIQCWGRGVNGQLGNGAAASSDIPVSVTGISNAIQVATGSNHSCALLVDGGIKCWGSAGYGALGNGSNTDVSIPVSVTGVGNAVQVAAGGDHSCAVLADGVVKCWGHGQKGQLGNGTNADSNVPVPVSNVSDATQVAAGVFQSCAVLADGVVKCWGRGAFGALGNGTDTNSNTPVTVTGFEGYTNCRRAPVKPIFDTGQETNAAVYRLYCAYFLRYPDTGGFTYWLTELQSGRVGLGDISDLFASSEEFRLTYGSLSNDDFLRLVYNNVMERQPDAAGFAYWLDLINQGTISRGDVMLYFAESKEFRNKTGT